MCDSLLPAHLREGSCCLTAPAAAASASVNGVGGDGGYGSSSRGSSDAAGVGSVSLHRWTGFLSCHMVRGGARVGGSWIYRSGVGSVSLHRWTGFLTVRGIVSLRLLVWGSFGPAVPAPNPVLLTSPTTAALDSPLHTKCPLYPPELPQVQRLLTYAQGLLLKQPTLSGLPAFAAVAPAPAAATLSPATIAVTTSTAAPSAAEGLPWCAVTWWPAAGAATSGSALPPQATKGAAISPCSPKHRNAPPPPSQGSPVTLLLLPGGHCCIFTPQHGSGP